MTHREGFRKFYDLSENVVPKLMYNGTKIFSDTINWACPNAFKVLWFATPTEITSFYNIISKKEAQNLMAIKKNGQVIPVEIEAAVFIFSSRYCLEKTFGALNLPIQFTWRIRILSPFDPVLRYRRRA